MTIYKVETTVGVYLFTTLRLAFDYTQQELNYEHYNRFTDCNRKLNPRSVKSFNTWKRHLKEYGDYYFEAYNDDPGCLWFHVTPCTVCESLDELIEFE